MIIKSHNAEDRPRSFEAFPHQHLYIVDLPALRTIPFYTGMDSPACA